MKPSKESVVAWRDLQKDPTIVELKKYLEFRVPVHEGNTIEQVALEAKRIEGFRDCIEAIFEEFTTLPPEAPEAGFMDDSDEEPKE